MIRAVDVLRGLHPAPMRAVATIANGAIAGLVGFMVFLTIHAAWITPIWSIALAGAAAAAGGGAAVGWACLVHRSRIPRGRMTRAAVLFGAGVSVLLLSVPVAFALFPGHRDFASIPPGRGVAALGAFLSLTAFVGGTAGWVATHTWRAAAVTALACVAFGGGIGHNAPILGAGPSAPKMWTIMIAATAAASITLASLEHSPARGAGGGSPAHPSPAPPRRDAASVANHH